MSTLVAKPVKIKLLNTKLLPIAAILLLVLALLFMATPLLRGSTLLSNGNGFVRQFNGQTLPNDGTGTDPGGQVIVPGDGTGTTSGGQVIGPGDGSGPQIQVGPGLGGQNLPLRQFGGQGSRLVGLGLFGGMAGTIVYALALLVSLAAAIGMFLAKRWGQVLGIIMAVFYLLLAVVSFLPMLLMSFLRGLNGLNLGLSLLHLALAIAVIVLALIPAKKGTAPVVPVTTDTPPEASA